MKWYQIISILSAQPNKPKSSPTTTRQNSIWGISKSGITRRPLLGLESTYLVIKFYRRMTFFQPLANKLTTKSSLLGILPSPKSQKS